jgi:hypothetical protein
MEIQDLSRNEHLAKRHKSPLSPRSIRGILIGKAGCSKTTLLLILLLRPGWLDYNNLNVFGKTLFQLEYRIIKTAFKQKLPKELIVQLFSMREEITQKKVDRTTVLEEVGRDNALKSDFQCKFYESSGDVPDPKDLNKTKKNFMIFDDLQLEKQNTCDKYYIRGRHSNVDSFCPAQNYFTLPKQTIRENANFICLFPQDLKNIYHIYNDHVSSDISKEEFRNLCKRAWSQPHRFVTIDLTSDKPNGKYRAGFDSFYIMN